MQQEELLFDKLGEHEERLVRIDGKLDGHEKRLITIGENVDKILDNQDFLHKKLNDMHIGSWSQATDQHRLNHPGNGMV